METGGQNYRTRCSETSGLVRATRVMFILQGHPLTQERIMDKFTFNSDQHGTFTADAERVTELVNFWNFNCGKTPLDFAIIQADVVRWLGYSRFEYLSDVCNRFAFAIMLVNSDIDQQYMADKTQEIKNGERQFFKSATHGM